uniref:Uncharacterized protein n=1 Tax=Sipha flava TaxID=143950 RepID=A0A2S2QFS1_9HEMI
MTSVRINYYLNDISPSLLKYALDMVASFVRISIGGKHTKLFAAFAWDGGRIFSVRSSSYRRSTQIRCTLLRKTIFIRPPSIVEVISSFLLLVIRGRGYFDTESLISAAERRNIQWDKS